MSSITDYSDLYTFVRHAAGDFGTYKDGSRVGDYKYQDDVIDNAITYNLLKMSSYSKVSGADQITPIMTDDNDIGYLINLIALKLVIADLLTAYKTRNMAVTKDLKYLIANILHDLQTFSNVKGLVHEKDGALEMLYDLPDRISDFVSANT